MKQHIANP